MLVRDRPTSPLTPERYRILRMMMEGKRPYQISAELGLNDSTVRSQISAIAQSVGAESTLQAIVICLRNQWLPLSDEPPQDPTPYLWEATQAMRALTHAILERRPLSKAQTAYLRQFDEFLRSPRDLADHAALTAKFTRMMNERGVHTNIPFYDRLLHQQADLVVSA